MAGAQSKQSNDDFAWSRFDPEAYVAHYYADPHPDDDEVVRLTCRALAKARPGSETIDVGTGPNLFPLFAALPVAKRLTVWEYAESNIAWMKREFSHGALRPPWTHFWDVACSAHGLKAPATPNSNPTGNPIGNPIAELAQRCDLVAGSIFELPQRRWDAATMFFCAESITAEQREFERACQAFAGAVKPGGVLAAAFLAGSRGYRVGEEDYPAVAINPEALGQAFAPLARDVEITPIGAMGEEIRSGYAGMLFLSGRAV
jgi:hypothetical protein